MTREEHLKRLADFPADEDLAMDRNMEISEEIANIMETLGISQKELANRMNKSEAEISKYLSGFHNFTIKTLAKIEIALNRRIYYTHCGAKHDKCKLVIVREVKELPRLFFSHSHVIKVNFVRTRKTKKQAEIPSCC